MNRYKIIITFLITVFLICNLFGCDKANKYGSRQSEDGRSYGGVIPVEPDEVSHTAFFDLTVDSVKEYTTYQFKDGLYQAEEGKSYFVVTFIIKNTYEKDLSMSITDFPMVCDGKEENPIYGFGKVDIEQEEMMDNVFSLKKGEEIKKSILYAVPDAETYQISYTEYYSDEFIGDQFYISISPDGEADES